MKVKEFIEKLQQLDQEKDIWLVYDCFYVSEPEVETLKDDDDCIGAYYGKSSKVGDYAIFAG